MIESDDEEIVLADPVFLITSTQKCWKCDAMQPVVALAGNWVEETSTEIGKAKAGETEFPQILCDVTELPQGLLQLINSFHPTYKKHSSRTAGRDYYANLCKCGANFGDFYLFMEPGGAFFPMSVEEASKMSIRTLSDQKVLKLRGTICAGTEGVIFEHAQRVQEPYRTWSCPPDRPEWRVMRAGLSELITQGYRRGAKPRRYRRIDCNRTSILR